MLIGNAAGGATQFATLTTHPTVDHTSFLLGEVGREQTTRAARAAAANLLRRC